jgi:hypothetical protein
MSFNLSQSVNSYREYIAQRMTIHFARLEVQNMLIAAQPNLAGVKLASLEFSEGFVRDWLMEQVRIFSSRSIICNATSNF